VEARKDVTVVLHPLTDDRRVLPLERTGELLTAPPSFMLVVSYNPGYQNVLKSLKPSTRQRFLAWDFDYPPPDQEVRIITRESGLDAETATLLVRLAGRIRGMAGADLEEAASTRLLVYCAILVRAGRPLKEAVRAAIIEPLSDDRDVKDGLGEVLSAILG
jgi:nitric oxide reductase NorQ protein